jgi:pimeloyl-ACP methyl ester carboxylesterase
MNNGWRYGAAGVLALVGAAAAAQTPWLAPCRLKGVEREAQCGVLKRPLDPQQPAGVQIDLHVAVLPALARNPKPDPLLFFAGGPGQSAIELAGTVQRMLARLGNRRDLVLIDQRGTGRSAPLNCDADAPTRPLAAALDTALQQRELDACRTRLMALPHGDLRQYVTPIAVQDAEAVRVKLGVQQINLIGVSYGTRMVLDYLRQFPQSVRRVVIDGVAPPDMVLPQASAVDTAAALEALFLACEQAPACSARHPRLRASWQGLLAAMPRSVRLAHPVTGIEETVTLTRDAVVSMVRQPLYVPALAAALPLAIDEAAAGRFAPMLGLSAALGSSRRGQTLAQGMHLSVICSEPHAAALVGAYERSCQGWPRAELPAAFDTLPKAAVAALVLSGGADPATPPRHGERVAHSLGPKARHVVVAQAGHGVMNLACMRDVVFRFIDAQSDDAAGAVDVRCADTLPRPPAFFLPVATP